MNKHYIKSLFITLLIGASNVLFSQNVAINLSGTPSASTTAILDLSDVSNNKLGVLLPNVSITSTSGIAPFSSTPTTGMIVWNTNAATVGGFGIGFYYWNGSQWNYIQNSGVTSAGWGTSGNSGTNPAINYAGTSDPQPFVIKTQGAERMRFLAGGGAGIGTATPASAVDVNGNMTIGTYAGTNAAPANGVIVSGQVGIGTTTPNPSAKLDLESTTQGLLPPQMTATQMAAIASPATGLVVLNTTSSCLEYYTGSSWQNVVCPCTGPPATPGAITGNASPCASSTGNVYTITAVPSAITYNWTVPAGATITAGAGTTSITVTFGATSGNISVTASNSCGTSASNSTLAITLNTVPSTPATPSGSTTPTISASSTYTIATVAGATSYTWSSSNTSLGAITLGQGTTSATITCTSTPGTFTICVYASNACGNSSTSCLTVTSSSCAHSTITFSSTGALQTWLVPACISQITIKLWGAGGGGGTETGNQATCGGGGAFVNGVLTVTGGSTLYLVVGKGGTYNTLSTTSYGGGGFAYNGNGYTAGGGGGRTSVQKVSGTDLVTAGGGGGGSDDYWAIGGGYIGYGHGGGGGATTGGAGLLGYSGYPEGGGGGTTTAGGAGGNDGNDVGLAGSLYTGGNAETSSIDASGGGGGGGYYGGGSGGSWWGGGGGGGSSYTTGAGFTLTTNTAGVTLTLGTHGTATPGGNADPNYPGGGVGNGMQNAAGGNGYIWIQY